MGYKLFTEWTFHDLRLNELVNIRLHFNLRNYKLQGSCMIHEHRKSIPRELYIYSIKVIRVPHY